MACNNPQRTATYDSVTGQFSFLQELGRDSNKDALSVVRMEIVDVQPAPGSGDPFDPEPAWLTQGFTEEVRYGSAYSRLFATFNIRGSDLEPGHIYTIQYELNTGAIGSFCIETGALPAPIPDASLPAQDLLWSWFASKSGLGNGLVPLLTNQEGSISAVAQQDIDTRQAGFSEAGQYLGFYTANPINPSGQDSYQFSNTQVMVHGAGSSRCGWSLFMVFEMTANGGNLLHVWYDGSGSSQYPLRISMRDPQQDIYLTADSFAGAVDNTNIAPGSGIHVIELRGDPINTRTDFYLDGILRKTIDTSRSNGTAEPTAIYLGNSFYGVHGVSMKLYGIASYGRRLSAGNVGTPQSAEDRQAVYDFINTVCGTAFVPDPV